MSPRLASLQERVPELVAAVLVFATVRQGAFYAPDSWATAAALVTLGGLCCLGRTGRGSSAHVVAALGVLFAAWWCYRTSRDGSWPLAHPMAAGALAFAACYAVGTSASARERARIHASLAVMGALAACAGLLGLALRLQPLALPAQEHFRLAGTLTYSNATGALLALLLLPALALPDDRRIVRSTSVYLIVAALLGTQSRGALLAALLGLLFLARRQIVASSSALALGGGVGALAVATSQDHERQPVLVLAVLAGLLAAGALAGRVPPARQVAVLAAALTLAAGLAGATVLRAEVVAVVDTRTGTESVSDRAYEWEAGWRAFRSAPLSGRGPGQPLLLSDGRQAAFTHNEPLQIAADAGLLGLGLATAMVVAAVASARRRGAPRWVHGALLTLLVCGLLDFSWHVPVILATAGLAASAGPVRVEPRAAARGGPPAEQLPAADAAAVGGRMAVPAQAGPR